QAAAEHARRGSPTDVGGRTRAPGGPGRTGADRTAGGSAAEPQPAEPDPGAVLAGSVVQPGWFRSRVSRTATAATAGAGAAGGHADRSESGAADGHADAAVQRSAAVRRGCPGAWPGGKGRARPFLAGRDVRHAAAGHAP